ncbi:MAG TPA: DUF3307 domain-containing protein [Candidatus Acidoferrales bacterium]
MMQPIEIGLALLLGHLIADFLLQSNALVRRKKSGEARGYLQHALLHYAAMAGVIVASAPSMLLRLRFQIVLSALTAIHLLIDWGKLRVTRSGAIRDGIGAFLADQALHVATIAAAALLYAGLPVTSVFRGLGALSPYREKILFVLVVYVAAVFAGGYVVRYITRSLLEKVPDTPDETHTELQNAGLYIGWLERILILTAVILRSPATIGLVLTAKSIVRYPELRSGRFAEYFLIGTLLSIILAISGGLILLNVLYGTFRFTW